MPDKKLGQYTQYDPTNYPAGITDDLTDAEWGRDSGRETLRAWPSSEVVPDTYAGPPPAREFETAGAAGPRGRSVQPPATTDASSVLPSIVPPPGHTAQP